MDAKDLGGELSKVLVTEAELQGRLAEMAREIEAHYAESGPPLLGEHTEAVLGGLLGLDAARIAALREKGVL